MSTKYTLEEEANAQRIRETMAKVKPVEGKDFQRMPGPDTALLEALRSVRNEFRSYVLKDPKNLDDAKGSRILAQIDRAIAQAEGKT